MQKKTALENGFIEELTYQDILEYLHIGQLFDIIKSKQFQKGKPNNIHRVNISPLIRRRNTIMHSRYISYQQYEEIKELCERVIDYLDDDNYSFKWNRFILEDIDSFSIPLIYVEYPLGKNFTKLIGREKELSEIKQLLKLPIPLSIIRHGGLGKTALVLQLIEDLLYSPHRQFDRIFFMSFKNSVFDNGVVRKLEKVISNHDDLIYKLAYYMDIQTEERADGSFNPTQRNMDLTDAEAYIGDLVSEGLSKGEITKLYKAATVAGDLVRNAHATDPEDGSPSSAYDALVRGLIDCDPEAHIYSSVFDAFGYSTRIIAGKSHADMYVKIGESWWRVKIGQFNKADFKTLNNSNNYEMAKPTF